MRTSLARSQLGSSPGVSESCREVMQRARCVWIDHPALEVLAGRIASGGLPPSAPPWDRRRHFCGDPDRTANYILALDALNFCFWAFPGEERWRIRYEGEILDGYWALAAALTRSIQNGLDLTDARVMASASRAMLAEVFSGQGEIPLLDARVANLREAGRVLAERYGGKMTSLIAACQGSGQRLALRVASEMSSFDDRASYDGVEVRFFKRAQILAVDLAACFEQAGPGRFDDLAELTAFADYKVPQVLRELGALEYTPELAAWIEDQRELPQGSPQEVEIRAATVMAVGDLAALLARRGIALTAVALDGLLWHLGQDLAFRHTYHRTRTIYY